MAVPVATNHRAYPLGVRLGRGAASEVYATRHPLHGPDLAIKLLHGTLESTSARPVAHPNVVRVVDIGEDFVVMERIDGEDLAAHLARGPLDETSARALFAAIADGMAAVHAAGIVHRDLKPANIMLRASGDPVIVDFGIAKSVGDAATSRRIGTPAYMAPEQITGGLISTALDVWAFGTMLFEAVTGALPFAGFTDGRAPQLFEVAPRARDLASISPSLDALIARCLERDPARRRREMADLARALRGEDDDERVTQDAGPLLAPHVSLAPAGASPPSPLAAAPSRLRPIVLLAAGALALAAVVGYAVARDAPASLPAPARAPIAAAPPAPAPAPAAPIAPASVASAPVPDVPDAPAAPTPFVVTITSIPAGATITIAGRPRGQTPARLELAAPASIVLSRRGYRAARVRADGTSELTVRLAPRPASRPRAETLD